MAYSVSAQGQGYFYVAPTLSGARELAAMIRQDGLAPVIRDVRTGETVPGAKQPGASAGGSFRPAAPACAS
jgi:hypothetical protein